MAKWNESGIYKYLPAFLGRDAMPSLQIAATHLSSEMVKKEVTPTLAVKIFAWWVVAHTCISKHTLQYFILHLGWGNEQATCKSSVHTSVFRQWPLFLPVPQNIWGLGCK